MESKFTFLGTGSSMGVPVIGCHCSVCKSENPKNRRMRCGGLFQVGSKRFLIDSGPDVRQQVLSHKIEEIDGFILTHSHYDHIGGFDDMKLFKKGEKKLPCLMLKETLEEAQIKFDYFFRKTEDDLLNSPFFTWQILNDPFGVTVFQDISFEYVTYRQAKMKVMGIKIGKLAYISDIKEFASEIFQRL